MNNLDKKKSDEWCRSLVEMVIKERNTPIDEWTDLVTGFGYYSGDNTWVLDEAGSYLPPDKMILQFSGFYLSEWEFETFKKTEGQSALKRIKFLTVLDSILERYQDFDSLERSWVRNEILIQIPSLEFKSKEQVKILKKKLDQIAALINDKRVIERAENLLEHKTHIVPATNPCKDVIAIKKDPLAADVIRNLLETIFRLNSSYKHESQELIAKLWASFLFFGIPKYSLEHILKANRRKIGSQKCH